MSEVRYAIRQLLESPGFTLVAILGLALGDEDRSGDRTLRAE